MVNIKFGEYQHEPLQTNVITKNIAIFFDGTKNNKNNTDARLKRVEPKNKSKAAVAYAKYGKEITDNNSYNNDWSNVARLWDNYDTTSRLYIEGIGTNDFDSDSFHGYVYGSKSTGIKKRVLKASKTIAEIIKPLVTKYKGKNIQLTLDVFGFSRGAAAGRHFVYEISKNGKNDKFGVLGKEFINQSIDINKIILIIRFLGLFDTVSSYSENGLTNFDDVEELKLDEIRKAKKIVHFTAEDEHREYFSLTDLKTFDKVKRKSVYLGVEKVFPGVHSDIGGGYDNGVEKKDEIITGHDAKLKNRKNELIVQGWFKDKQLKIHESRPKLSSTRYVKKTYSYIPLHFMAKYGVDCKLPFNMEILIKKYSISNDALLVRVKEKLDTYINGTGKKYSFTWIKELQKQYNIKKISKNQYEKLLQEQTDLRKLRNEYLHWSADYDGVGMNPEEDGNRVIH